MQLVYFIRAKTDTEKLYTGQISQNYIFVAMDRIKDEELWIYPFLKVGEKKCMNNFFGGTLRPW